MRHVTLVGIALAFVVIGCEDRSRPPARSAPELTTIASPGSGSSYVVMDAMRAEPTWLDLGTLEVSRLRSGAIERVQDRTLTELPSDRFDMSLRVFDDGGIVVLVDGVLHIYPVGEGAWSIDLGTIDAAVDGVSTDDFWYVGWFLDERDYALCHHTAAAEDCGTPIPNVGAYSARLAVGSDGSVYVTDRDEALYRYADGALEQVGTIPSGVTSFRRSGDTVFALGYGLFIVEPTGIRKVDAGYPVGVVGQADDFYLLSYDSESVQVDPECRSSFLTSCETRTLWHQLLIERVQGGARSVVGYEDCTDATPAPCSYGADGLGLDGDRVVVIGVPLRAVP
jgi:hypothetical protein